MSIVGTLSNVFISRLLRLLDTKDVHRKLFVRGFAVPFRLLRRKYFPKPVSVRFTQFLVDDEVTLRGGPCGLTTKATPGFSLSARHLAFNLA